MKLLVLCILAMLLAAPAAAQQVYKCPGAGGKVEFQQTPCAGGKGEAVVVREGNVVEGNPAGEANLRTQAMRDATVRSAIERRQLVSGMTTAEMQQVMGAARVVNSDYFGNTVRQQHVYRWPDGSTRYVYTENGVVTGLQERPGYGTSTPKPGCGPNATGDLRFQLGSVTRTPEEKADIRRRIEAIEQRCR